MVSENAPTMTFRMEFPRLLGIRLCGASYEVLSWTGRPVWRHDRASAKVCAADPDRADLKMEAREEAERCVTRRIPAQYRHADGIVQVMTAECFMFRTTYALPWLPWLPVLRQRYLSVVWRELLEADGASPYASIPMQRGETAERVLERAAAGTEKSKREPDA